MSTYVLGFAIIDFNYKAFELDEVQGGLTIWAKTPDPVVHTFAIGMATSIMSASQKYFTVKFPIPKLDVIVIRDRSGIAPVIETWGLIVLQDYYEIENVFVVVAGEMTARVIADQMVHQWFGNLVTIKSWTESWLIEGFSKYLSIVFIEQFLPEWELLNGETTADFISIFDLDCLRNTEAVSCTYCIEDWFNIKGFISDELISRL